MREKPARRAIVKYARELWERRLVSGTSGNLSARLEDGILVTPAGRSLRDLVESELVIVPLAPADPKTDAPATSELPLHRALYAARNDVRVAIHTHPAYCVVWSQTGEVFPRDTVGARETLRDLVFTAYRRPGTADLAAIVAGAVAAGANNVLMQAHGLTCIGRTFEEAFVQTDLAEEAARVAYLGRWNSGGRA